MDVLLIYEKRTDCVSVLTKEDWIKNNNKMYDKCEEYAEINPWKE